MLEGRLSINVSVTGLWIGPGLLRLRESSRQWGLRWAILSALLATIAAPFFLLGPNRLPLTVFTWPHGDVSRWWPFAASTVLAAIAAWQAWVLQRRDIRAMFVQSSGDEYHAAHTDG